MSLLEQISEIEILKNCWRKIYRGKTKQQRKDSKGADGMSLKDFKDQEDEYISEISEILRDGKFKFSSLKGIPKRKPGKDKDRLICVPAVRDRIVQRAILHIINEFAFKYVNTGVSYCGIRKNSLRRQKGEEIKNINSAIDKLIEHVKIGRFFIFESDLKGFFDRVPKAKLYKKIIKLLPDSSINSLIHDVIHFHLENWMELEQNERIDFPDKHIGIAQGSSLSPLFSNIYLADFDRKMHEKYGDAFIRYVDDFLVLVSTEEESSFSETYTTNLLKAEGLELSPEKTHHCDLRLNRIEFLGLGIDKNGISCRIGKKQVIKNINEEALNKSRLKKPHEKSISNRIFVTRANSKITGWSNFYKRYHVEGLFAKINDLIQSRKAKNPALNLLKPVEFDESDILISLEEWRGLFKA